MTKKVNIRQLATGVPGLDSLLGGGLPEFSFNLIAGLPGCGKTTLAHQIMFSLANKDSPALFFTVLGEPALKMLRYQQQFPFFDFSKINQCIHFVNLSADLLEGHFDHVLKRIEAEVKNYSPALVFVDSFRSVAQSTRPDCGATDLQQFIQLLSMQMSSWQATTFLIGEYLLPQAGSNPVFTVADGILWMTQNLQNNSMVRKMQVVKLRGQAQVPGLHTFRITDDGIQVFPRGIIQQDTSMGKPQRTITCADRISMGVAELDDMLGGGLPAGYFLLVVGPSGSGKTILATEFLAEGVRQGEPGIIAAFEKSPSQLLSYKLNELIDEGKIGVINTRLLDLSIDETLNEMIAMITQMKAKRVVIDSLSGFELALAPEFQEDFRGSLYRMIAELAHIGVTTLMTSELEDRYTDLRFSPNRSAFLADAIIVQRYVELDGQLKRALSVVKVRGSQHCKDIRLFEINDGKISMGNTLAGYAGILSGRPMVSP